VVGGYRCAARGRGRGRGGGATGEHEVPRKGEDGQGRVRGGGRYGVRRTVSSWRSVDDDAREDARMDVCDARRHWATRPNGKKAGCALLGKASLEGRDTVAKAKRRRLLRNIPGSSTCPSVPRTIVSSLHRWIPFDDGDAKVCATVGASHKRATSEFARAAQGLRGSRQPLATCRTFVEGACPLMHERRGPSATSAPRTP